MKLYICTDHACHYPVGVASVVVAADVDRARELLDLALIARGLKGSEREPYTLIEMDLREEGARVLCDGEY